MEVEITLKRALAILTVIAWIATFVQGFNAIWGFWPFPNSSVVGYSGHWLASAGLTTILATVLIVWWALVGED